MQTDCHIYSKRLADKVHMGGRRLPPNIRNIINNTIKMKNRIFAIPVAAPAIPPKPKAAAIIAIIKNTNAQPNIILSLAFCGASLQMRINFAL